MSSNNFDEFANALQLSIKTRIEKIIEDNGEALIYFDSAPGPDDKNLHRFLGLLEGKWSKSEKVFTFKNKGDIDWTRMTLFLLLARMNEQNILNLVQIDPSMADIAQRLGIKMRQLAPDTVEKCSKIVFAAMKEKKMTIRDLAQKTGLTQTSISNFKRGKDIRLSNFLKIVKVVGIKYF